MAYQPSWVIQHQRLFFIIKGFRTIVFIFIVISITFQSICPPAGGHIDRKEKQGRGIYRPKRCGNNNKDNNPKILNDKNHQASSQKFRQLKPKTSLQNSSEIIQLTWVGESGVQHLSQWYKSESRHDNVTGVRTRLLRVAVQHFSHYATGTPVGNTILF